MKSSEIYHHLERIADVSGANAKKELLRECIDDLDFRKVLNYALNPFQTYGITGKPTTESRGFDEFRTETWGVLDALASRKLTGDAARAALVGQVVQMNEASVQLLYRILNKDLRSGIGISTVNAVWKGLIPKFSAMLAHKYEEKRVKFPVAIEPKLDGVRVLAFVDYENDLVQFFSRSGKEFTAFDSLRESLLALRANVAGAMSTQRVVFDGEVTAGSFNRTVSEVRRKGYQAEDAIFTVFDVLPQDVFRLQSSSGQGTDGYVKRRMRLIGIIDNSASNVRLNRMYVVRSHSEIAHYYETFRANGLEGAIVKALDGQYQHKRSFNWMKIKGEETADLEIVDMVEGTGKYEGMLGALIVDHNGIQVNVGSGLSDAQRASFWESAGDPDVTIVGRVAEIEYHEVTPDGSLRHPRFVRFRDALTGAKE